MGRLKCLFLVGKLLHLRIPPMSIHPFNAEIFKVDLTQRWVPVGYNPRPTDISLDISLHRIEFGQG